MVALPITVNSIRALAARGEKLVMVTAYDAPAARLAEAGGAELLLVGDSLGMVVLGYDDTLKVTMEDILHHTKAVMRGRERAMVVADMPFMSYQISPEQAVANAGRLIQEGGAHAVKLEGGARVAEAIRRILDAGIPVMGHLGLTPQSINAFGGYKVQAKTVEEAQQLLRDAHLLEELGVFALVLECIPADLAARVAEELTIPVIGIGAGAEVDGQVLVYHDLLRYGTQYAPKFVRAYADLNTLIPTAVRLFTEDVKAGRFPTPAEAYAPAPALLEALSAIAHQVETSARGGEQ